MDGFCFLHSFNFPQSALMTYTRAVAEISLEHLIKFLTLQKIFCSFFIIYKVVTDADLCDVSREQNIQKTYKKGCREEQAPYNNEH